MALNHAIKHLFPDAIAEIDFQLQDDGEGPYIAAWNLPDPQPDEATLAQAAADYLAAAIAAEQARQQLRDQIKTLAQSAVGETLDNLTQAQLKSLVAILLWKAGAVANDLTINPLSDWVRE
jgi:GAF domain-containing protein